MGSFDTPKYSIKLANTQQPLIGATMGQSKSPKSWILAIIADSLNGGIISIGGAGAQNQPISPGGSVTFNKGEIPYDVEMFITGLFTDDRYTVVVYNE